MALSGSFSTNTYDDKYLIFSWTATQSTANNQSTISWTLKGAGGSGYSMAGAFKVVIAGETVYSSEDRIELRNGTLVASGTKTITHNADGTKSFSASAEAGIYTYAVSSTGNGSWTLDTIPRASTPSCSSTGKMGSSITIYTNRASSSFTHTLSYKFGSKTGTIATGVGASYAWSIPDLASYCNNALSATCTITCDTYSGSTKIGTKTCTFTLSVPNASAPSLSKTTFELGEQITISTNRGSSNFTHTLYYSWGEQSWFAIEFDVTSTQAWTLPLSMAEYISQAVSGTGQVRCDTYNGSKLVGTKYVNFTGTLPSSVKPTVSAIVNESTNYMATYGALVKTLSKLRVQSAGAGVYGSTITALTVKVDGQTYTGADITTKAIMATDTAIVSVEVTATDTRGRVSEPWTVDFTALDYAPPNVSALNVHRCDADGTENDKGEYVQATFSATVTPLNDHNSAVYTLKYTALGEDSTATTEIEITELEGAYTVSGYEITPFVADGDYSFQIEIEVRDDIQARSRSTSVSTAFTLMNLGADGTSLSLGKIAEKERSFEVALNQVQLANFYAAGSGGTANTAGWVHIANIQTKAADTDGVIQFELTRRANSSPMTLYLNVETDATTLQSSIKWFKYDGLNFNTTLVLSADQKSWDLYVEKNVNDDFITIQRWGMPELLQDKLEVSFPGDHVTTPPAGAGQHTPVAVHEHLTLDSVYPPGSFYESTNSISPGELFGGTWEQIYADYDYRHIGSNVIYDSWTSSAKTGKVAVLGAYNTGLLDGLKSKITTPPGYTYKVSMSAQGYTGQGNHVKVYLNSTVMLDISTWSGDTYKIISCGDKKTINEIGQETTYKYSSNGINLYFENTAANPCAINNITVHAWLISDDIIYKWRRTA